MRTCFTRSACCALVAALSHASLVWADSGVGVDTWHADKLDPTGWQLMLPADSDGISWLQPGELRSPTGNLYLGPVEAPHTETYGEWQMYGTFDVGYLLSHGDKTALFDRYTAWPGGGASLDVDVNFERPSDGSYAELRASRISDEDQYYEAVYGKAGAYKAEVFIRDMPNILSTDAKSIWNGVGTNNLTLH